MFSRDKPDLEAILPYVSGGRRTTIPVGIAAACLAGRITSEHALKSQPAA